MSIHIIDHLNDFFLIYYQYFSSLLKKISEGTLNPKDIFDFILLLAVLFFGFKLGKTIRERIGAFGRFSACLVIFLIIVFNLSSHNHISTTFFFASIIPFLHPVVRDIHWSVSGKYNSWKWSFKASKEKADRVREEKKRQRQERIRQKEFAKQEEFRLAVQQREQREHELQQELDRMKREKQKLEAEQKQAKKDAERRRREEEQMNAWESKIHSRQKKV